MVVVAAISSDPWTILGYILLGSVLSMIGQGIRVFVGLKKAQEEAEADKQNISWNQWFDSKQLITSLVIALVIGAVAGALGILPYMSQPERILTIKDIELLIIAGYAGTDLIEGFISSNKLPA
ncbi:MAG: hypothetical protein LUO89_04280 [Methanothrix sp.]|nr:hypothetical protein [Methanothrix sp.]